MKDVFIVALIAAAVLPLYTIFSDAFDEYYGNGWSDVARALPALVVYYCCLGAVGSFLLWMSS
jgi:hypothetical protein